MFQCVSTDPAEDKPPGSSVQAAAVMSTPPKKRALLLGDLSPEHRAFRNQSSRQRCSECGITFSRRYFFTHKEKCLLKANSSKANLETRNEVEVEAAENVPSQSYDDAENDMTDHACNISTSLRRSVRRILEQRVQNSHDEESANDGSTSGDSDTERETWDILPDDIMKDWASEDNEVANDDFPPEFVSVSLTSWVCMFLVFFQIVFVLPDSVLVSVLAFLKQVFQVLAEETQLPLLTGIASLLPGSLYMLWRFLKVDSDNFQKLVVCRKCYNIYQYKDCWRMVEGKKVSRNCPFVDFPQHTQRARQTTCGEKLLKEITVDSKTYLYPFKTYSYKPISETLVSFLKRPDFEKKCEHWKSRNITENVLRDVYDGQVWKDFQKEEKNKFLLHSSRYAIMLNLDWFQPFKHVRYSVGVVYAVVLNLPRSERFLLRNVVVVGVIPDCSKEPPTNTFIQPLVTDLLNAWNTGINTKTFLSPTENVNVRFALLCVGCDIPASRKLCGFLGHAAVLGCSKCHKKFPGEVGNRDYSGFQKELWPPKDLDKVKENMLRVREAKTQVQRQNLATQYGVRYSCLIQLPYFDVVRMSIIDPMHNVYLGTAKHMIKVWTEMELLTEKTFSEIQDKTDQIEVPASMGRIPRKIRTSFSGFTAEQWKNWTNVFSLMALKDVIDDKFVFHWAEFVEGSRLLCMTQLTEEDINKIDACFNNFCLKFEQLYGKGPGKITPNMHLHGHLASCLRDYGPVQSFWLFSFERYNGYLGALPNNNKCVEIQFMRRFQRDEVIASLPLPDTFRDRFSHLMPSVLCISDAYIDEAFCIRMSKLALAETPLIGQPWTDISAYETLHVKHDILSPGDKDNISKMYKVLYPDTMMCSQNTTVSVSVKKCSAVKVGCQVLGSVNSRHKRSAFILANWNAGNGKIIIQPNEINNLVCPGVIESFLIHNFVVNGDSKVHLLAKVLWFCPVQPRLRNYNSPKPITVWCPSAFDVMGESSFIPVQRISSTCVKYIGTVQGTKVMFVCPATKLL